MTFSRFCPTLMGASLLILQLSCVPSDTSESSGAGPISYIDVEYTSGEGYSLQMDVVVPGRGLEPYPIIAIFYGSSFTRDDRHSLDWLVPDFLDHGYAAATIDCRWSPEYHFPAQINDAKAAIRWLRAHADEYGIDPRRIGVDGFSSGGYLALMLAVTDPDDGFDLPDGAFSGVDSSVQAAVAHSPVVDLLFDSKDPYRVDFLGVEYDQAPELWRAASVTTYIDAEDVPILTTYGLEDHDISIEEMYLLDKRMQQKYNNHNLVVTSLQRHVPIYNDMVWAFLDMHLRD